MLGRIFRAIGYLLYFVVALVGFLYLSIPTEKVKVYVQHQASTAMKSRVRIGELKLRGLGGVTLQDVSVMLPVKPLPVPGAAPGAPGGPAAAAPPTAPDAKPGDGAAPAASGPGPGLVMADRIDLDVNLLGLLMKKPLKARISAEISGGTLSGGRVEKTAEGFQIHVEEISGVNLEPTRLFRVLPFPGVDIHGQMSGKVDFLWGKSLATSQGKVELTIADARVPHFEFRTPMAAIELFEIDAGEVEIGLRLDEAKSLPGRFPANVSRAQRVLLIEKLSARGPDIELRLDPGQKHYLTLGPGGFKDATIDLRFEVHFTKEFLEWKGDGVREDGEVVKGVGHALAKMVLDTQPMFKNARVQRPKGWYYGFHCTGRFGTPNLCKPEKPSRVRFQQPKDPTPGAPAAPGSANAVRPTPPVPAFNRPPPRPSAARPAVAPTLPRGRSSRTVHRLRERTRERPRTAVPTPAALPPAALPEVEPLAPDDDPIGSGEPSGPAARRRARRLQRAEEGVEPEPEGDDRPAVDDDGEREPDPPADDEEDPDGEPPPHNDDDERLD